MKSEKVDTLPFLHKLFGKFDGCFLPFYELFREDDRQLLWIEMEVHRLMSLFFMVLLIILK